MRLMLIGAGFIALGFALMAIGVYMTPRRSVAGFTAAQVKALSAVGQIGDIVGIATPGQPQVGSENNYVGTQMVAIGCGALDRPAPEPECAGK